MTLRIDHTDTRVRIRKHTQGGDQVSAIFRRATNLLSLLSDYNSAIHTYIYTHIYTYRQREKKKEENGVKFVAA